jgi:hypothetical protein
MNLAWFLIGTGFGFIGLALIARHLMENKLLQYIESIKVAGRKEAANLNRETSELYLRDKKGDLFKVKITVDYNVKAEHYDLQSCQRGRISDIFSGRMDVPKDMADCKEFVFSSRAVEDMAEAGITPDQVVVNMLKAAGKIS